MRFRTAFIFGGCVAVILALVLTDPDKGLSTSMALLSVAGGVIALAATHFSRKALHDYIDMKVVAAKAQEHPIGAGLVFAGICVVTNGLLSLFGGLLMR